MSDNSKLASLLNKSVVDQDGESIGKVADIYVDEASDEPQWLKINSGLFGRNACMIPMMSVVLDVDDHIVSTVSKELADSAPDLGDEFSSDQEADLYRHFGMNYFQGGLTGTPDVAAVETADDVSIGRTPSRLRKYSPKEARPIDIPVAHDE